MYKAVDQKVNFPKAEEKILEFWEKNDIFKQSIAQREAGGNDFVFYDGPPFATGLPHFGHFVPNTIKDIIPRYQTMKGRRVERRFGWDCHGLPVENLIEKELGLNSKTDIEHYGISRFNEACRASVLRYVAEWRRIITRLGRWVDFDHDYKTMDAPYMESIWAVIKMLFERGLLYEGYYILPYCPRCATVLSNHELNLGGYQDVHDPAITVRFKIRQTQGGESPPRSTPTERGASATPPAGDTPATPPPIPADSYFLAWTTTPWTLPSNMALTLGPDIEYVLIEDLTADGGGKHYILAEARLSAYYKEPTTYKIIWRTKGANLSGIEYEPLFPYFATAQNAFRTFTGDFVSTEDGTGIVHTAPGFGEDDQRVLRGSGIPVVCPVDAECRFTAEVPDYEGRFVKDCDKDIIDRLKKEGRLVKRDQILHAYPHCWRCGHPLIYRAVSSWFVNIQKIKQDMLAANEQIHWVPAHIKHGRFGKWLEGARDWAISRNRYWGNPIPIWKCPDCGKITCVGSIAELKKLSGKEPKDLHKHFVDEITIPCSCGGVMRRVSEVLDCWFESGSMPYAQSHYPFENKEFFETHFPADFINEGLDQTRGWFYTLTVLAAALFKRPAFKNCIVSGLVLASDGKKMSKSLKNYTDPMDAVNMFGADALRLFLVHSAVVKADDLRYSDEGVRDVLKSILLPLWNAYSFFVTYANIDGINPAPPPDEPSNPLDKWILSAAQTLVSRVGTALDDYDLSRAVDPIVEFIDLLNNWYIRRSRRRFWRSADNGADNDKNEAYAALLEALLTLIKTAAPFMPFTTEMIWQNLRREDDPVSVHLADWPVPQEKRFDRELEFKMSCVQRAVTLGRALRSAHNIKNRQPLLMVSLVTRDSAEKNALLEMENIIREELNVKKVVWNDNEEDLVEYQAKANFRALGKELGKDMKAAAEKIEQLSRSEIQSILEGSTLSIEILDRVIDISAEKLDIKRIEKTGLKVINEGSLTVALDTKITEDLALEGFARDLVRGIQNLRKASGLEVSDRIRMRLSGPPRLKRAWELYSDYISAELLAVSVNWLDPDPKTGHIPETEKLNAVETGGETWMARIEKETLPN
ncbi:MAG: isoleucine--tRNA ligase [Spirochaetaceae bacterium]|jgi:isoleucyl-tRNA synthetase|nr:isoleucine--tRNA ligase [Spirochaetaceae bacterium]